MAKSNVKDNGDLGISATIKTKKPKDSDYYLCGIRIEPAENGVIVNCEYQIKPTTKEKNSKQEIYCGEYRPGEKTIFKSYDEAADFLSKKIKEIGAN